MDLAVYNQSENMQHLTQLNADNLIRSEEGFKSFS
jgi:hypothetical protein